MTSDVYNECVKALAYGYTAATVADMLEMLNELGVETDDK